MKRELRAQIFRQCVRIINIQKKDHKGDKHEIIQREFDKLYDTLKQDPKLLLNINRHDVWDFFHPIPIDKKHPVHLTRTELEKEIDDFFFGKPNIYYCYFRVGNKTDFPEGYKLGIGVFHTIENLPERASTFIKTHMPYERSEERRIFGTAEAYVKFRENDAYLEIQVEAIGFEKAKEKSFLIAKRCVNLVKFTRGNFYNDYLTRSPFFYYITSQIYKRGELSEGNEYESRIYKTKYDDEILSKLTIIFNKKSPNSIEQRILNAIDVYGLIEDTTPLHVRFLFCIVGIETLLLDKNDRDYLRWKMAEKISFLLADSRPWIHRCYDIPYTQKLSKHFVSRHLTDSRIKLYEKIVKLYDKRSSFAHSGFSSSRDEITIDDYHLAEMLFRFTTQKLLDLLDKEITHIARKNEFDKHCLDDLIQKMKFK